ncbi:MAG: winged helix-turn-helix domain-containing protein [Patescibacteria group bacterium]|nr:winged helix-turn-helix domain-containing protein [Patescibacteria group bacterium]
MDTIIRTRITILQAFNDEALTQGDLVRKLNMDPEDVHTHLQKLIDLELLEDKIEEEIHRYYLKKEAESKVDLMIKSFKS